jgi:hypothetical protein
MAPVASDGFQRRVLISTCASLLICAVACGGPVPGHPDWLLLRAGSHHHSSSVFVTPRPLQLQFTQFTIPRAYHARSPLLEVAPRLPCLRCRERPGTHFRRYQQSDTLTSASLFTPLSYPLSISPGQFLRAPGSAIHDAPPTTAHLYILCTRCRKGSGVAAQSCALPICYRRAAMARGLRSETDSTHDMQELCRGRVIHPCLTGRGLSGLQITTVCSRRRSCCFPDYFSP